jgi:hypothetical protein
VFLCQKIHRLQPVSRIPATFHREVTCRPRIHISNEPDPVFVFPSAMAAGKSFLAQSGRIDTMGSVVNRDRIFSMKPRTLLATGIVVLVRCGVLVAAIRAGATIAELQRRLANVSAVPTNEAVRTVQCLTTEDLQRSLFEERSDDSAARIAQLERVADGQADIIEDLLRRLEAFEQMQQKARASGWSALQATGAPDSPRDGDQQTAWAPAQADGGEEWLELEYANGVPVAQVNVREVCGTWLHYESGRDCWTAARKVPIWQGEPPVNAAPSDTVFAAPANIVARRVKVYLDTKRVAGWNEIDAVELIGAGWLEAMGEERQRQQQLRYIERTELREATCSKTTGVGKGRPSPAVNSRMARCRVWNSFSSRRRLYGRTILLRIA